MAYRDLEHFVQVLEEKGMLKRIAANVSPELEITEISDRVIKSGGPALLFEQVEGHTYPVVTNLFGTMERTCLALEVDSPDRIADNIRRLLKPPAPGGLVDKLKVLPLLGEMASLMPKTVKRGACQQVVEEKPDLDQLPILKCWPNDSGRFITLPLVFTRDPDTGRRNLGMYRMQVYDGKTTGMHWQIHKHGADQFRRARKKNQRLEAAVALGADPATIYAATAPLPAGIDELWLAGFLRKAPVEMVKCRTVDLEVPAQAEFVLEGYVDPYEARTEGPFGDHTGFYTAPDQYPVFHLTCITRKEHPIYPATVVGKPPMEDFFLGKVTERVFLPLLQMLLPEIVDMELPAEGVFHNCAIVSIRKSYPGHARKIMNALWGMGQMMFTKVLILVDAEVNVHDLSEVAWTALANTDPKRDVVITEGPLDALDHAVSTPGYGGKMMIDATRKGTQEGFPRPWPDAVEMSLEVKRMVDAKWDKYGL